MTKSSVLRFSKYGVFQERGIYRRKIREKQGVFIERKSIANSKKARKCWAFEAMPSRAYESSFVVNGGERGIRTLDTRERILTFQASPFSHSGTSPIFGYSTE
jgi:hypothetical protein